MDNKKPRTSWSYYEYVDAYNNLEAENAKLKEEIDSLTTDLKASDKERRCPSFNCGGRLEGLGYDQPNALVIFQCKKCGAQIHISKETWERALKGESDS